jgi:hypothetical protein
MFCGTEAVALVDALALLENGESPLAFFARTRKLY